MFLQEQHDKIADIYVRILVPMVMSSDLHWYINKIKRSMSPHFMNYMLFIQKLYS